jgi:rSAM/selenodomain-associated transferase 1
LSVVIVAELLIAQLARAPVVGQVKTRLLPALNPQRTADLHAAMVLYICRRLAPAGTLQLWVDGDSTAPLFRACLAAGAESLRQQRGDDLGARMSHIVDVGVEDFDKVILVGSDAPGLNASHVGRVAAALDDADAAFVPATDGGYVMLGLKAPCPELFTGLPWGTSEVLELSLAALAAVGKRAHLLEPLPDIDRPEDLCHLPEDLDW